MLVFAGDALEAMDGSRTIARVVCEVVAFAASAEELGSVGTVGSAVTTANIQR
jgi:catabolite regulation protein CreA